MISGGGQVPLRDPERNRIDVSIGGASVPHAQGMNGIARDAGVDDWSYYYGPTVSVDERREMLERAVKP